MLKTERKTELTVDLHVLYDNTFSTKKNGCIFWSDIDTNKWSAPIEEKISQFLPLTSPITIEITISSARQRTHVRIEGRYRWRAIGKLAEPAEIQKWPALPTR